MLYHGKIIKRRGSYTPWLVCLAIIVIMLIMHTCAAQEMHVAAEEATVSLISHDQATEVVSRLMEEEVEREWRR